MHTRNNRMILDKSATRTKLEAMRGFFGFGLASDFSAKLAAAVNALPVDPQLSPLDPADYHVTIKFLSQFSSPRFLACLEELIAIGDPPLHDLRAGKIALWPTVLALECEAGEKLREWRARVNACLERQGFLRERHPIYRPHVTVARRKTGREPLQVAAALPGLEKTWKGQTVPLEAPALWQSVAEETGRRHRPFLSLNMTISSR